jgi:hypothetical protein
MNRKSHYLASLLFILFMATLSASGQSRPPTPPDQPVDLSKAVEGSQLTISKTYEDTYQAVLDFLKKDYVIASADRETGKIVTEGKIEGGYQQTKRTICILLARSDPNATTLRVAMLKQNRRKAALQTRPWGETKLDKKESEKLAENMKAALEKPAASS